MKDIFYSYLVNPIILICLYIFYFIKDAGLTIIIITFFLKITLLPLNYIIYQEEEKIKKVNKKINETTKNIKDLVKKSEIISKIYKEEGISPFKNLFLQLINLPILIAVFIAIPQFLNKINNYFLFNFMNLKSPNITLGLIVFMAQLLLIFFLTAPEQRKISLFISSLLAPIFFIIPSGLLIYIFATIIFTLLERKVIFVNKV
ncbi:MAG: hypothetical protein KatS3mg094_318 [Candidatus Parcubacteria bacterium]|nr:MAG: hypothetical protein KatS3mg094_318 [Candidatus Parcubacteria bacterium]